MTDLTDDQLFRRKVHIFDELYRMNDDLSGTKIPQNKRQLP